MNRDALRDAQIVSWSATVLAKVVRKYGQKHLIKGTFLLLCVGTVKGHEDSEWHQSES